MIGCLEFSVSFLFVDRGTRVPPEGKTALKEVESCQVACCIQLTSIVSHLYCSSDQTTTAFVHTWSSKVVIIRGHCIVYQLWENGVFIVPLCAEAEVHHGIIDPSHRIEFTYNELWSLTSFTINSNICLLFQIVWLVCPSCVTHILDTYTRSIHNCWG